MSKYGGCLVCGQVLNPDDNLLCRDCAGPSYNYMKNTGTKAKYIELTDNGPIDVTEDVETWKHDSYMRWNEDLDDGC